MIDLEREIRDALRWHAHDLPAPSPAGAPAIARRARRRQARNGLVAVAVVALLVLGLTGGVSALLRAERHRPADTPTPSPPGPPVASEPTEPGLYVLDPGSGMATMLIHGRRWSDDPVRSPDGTRFALEARSAGGKRQIFVLDPDGVERQITDLEHGAGDPDWSPDGTRIAFVGRGPEADVYIVNADGSGLRLVGGTDGVDVAPDWSPDGTRIAFGTSAGRHSGIWLLGVDDGTVVRLTEDGRGDGDRDPAWSPDGTRIAFLRYEDAPGRNLEDDDHDLWVMRPDGTDPHRLVEAEGPLDRTPYGLGAASPDGHWQTPPAWSPDGRQVAWSDVHSGVRVLDVRSQEISTVAFGFHGSLQWGADGIVVGWAPYRE